MGRDKSSLPMPGGDLLSYQEGRFREAGFHVYSRIADHFSDFPGPLAGIHAALRQHPEVSDWLAIPVDMPRIGIGSVQRLIGCGEQQQRACCFQDCPLPLYLPASPDTLRLLESWLMDEQGPRSVFALMHALNGVWLDSNGLGNELMNVNTPEQWQGFLTGAETV